MKRLIGLGLVALAVWFLIQAARAQDSPPLPDYDIHAVCTSGTQHMDEQTCTNFELGMRLQVKQTWPSLTAAQRSKCLAVNKWGSYETLLLCVRGL